MQRVINIQEVEQTIDENDEMVVSKNEKNNVFDKETVEKLLKSEEDIKKGRTRKAASVIKELKEKYGF